MPWCAEGYKREAATMFVDSQGAAWRDGREYSFVILEGSRDIVARRLWAEPI